jgi:flagellar motility protein MotE (MotC chaperone)
MEFRLRLLPIGLVAIVGLLGIRIGNVWHALDTPFATAHAEAAPEAPKPAAPPAKPAGETAAAAAATPPAPHGAPEKAVDPMSMSPSEVELLQQLAERRAELDRRAADLSQREVLLQAAEKRIDEKIARLASLEKDIGGIVDKQDQEDDARLKSLVKIYETMKPQDAARIFEQLDMPVLLSVVEHMKERIAAPILAAMDPARARSVTLALAERRDQREKAAAGQKPPVTGAR